MPRCISPNSSPDGVVEALKSYCYEIRLHKKTLVLQLWIVLTTNYWMSKTKIEQAVEAMK